MIKIQNSKPNMNLYSKVICCTPIQKASVTATPLPSPVELLVTDTITWWRPLWTKLIRQWGSPIIFLITRTCKKLSVISIRILRLWIRSLLLGFIMEIGCNMVILLSKRMRRRKEQRRKRRLKGRCRSWMVGRCASWSIRAMYSLRTC